MRVPAIFHNRVPTLSDFLRYTGPWGRAALCRLHQVCAPSHIIPLKRNENMCVFCVPTNFWQFLGFLRLYAFLENFVPPHKTVQIVKSKTFE